MNPIFWRLPNNEHILSYLIIFLFVGYFAYRKEKPVKIFFATLFLMITHELLFFLSVLVNFGFLAAYLFVYAGFFAVYYLWLHPPTKMLYLWTLFFVIWNFIGFPLSWGYGIQALDSWLPNLIEISSWGYFALIGAIYAKAYFGNNPLQR